MIVLTADDEFAEFVRCIFSASAEIGLDVVRKGRRARDEIDVDGASVLIADLDTGGEVELQALERMMTRIGNSPPVIAVTQSFDGAVARRLVQMRVTDFLIGRCRRSSRSDLRARRQGAGQCGDDGGAGFTFLPAGGRMPARPRSRCRPPCCSSTVANGAKPLTCLVDLDFQHGACADYLDVDHVLISERSSPGPEAPGPAIARNHALASRLRASGDCGAEPASGNALL